MTIDLIDTYGVRNITIGPIRLESIPATNLWFSLDPCVITWQDGDSYQQRFEIPAGMQTDLASVPLRAQSIISPCGPIKDAAYMHDGLYQYRPILAQGYRISRAQADYMLYLACIEIGKMHRNDAWIVYTAVRVGGSRIWHAHDAEFNSTPDVVVVAAHPYTPSGAHNATLASQAAPPSTAHSAAR